jgi:hypothetical protein
MYGGDMVLVYGSNDGCICIPSPQIAQNYTESKLPALGQDYEARVDTKYSVRALPQFDGNPMTLGRFINDAYAGNVSQMTPDSYFQSMQHANSTFKATKGGLGLVVVATRDISAQEEILTSYGFHYWQGFVERQRERAISSK